MTVGIGNREQGLRSIDLTDPRRTRAREDAIKLALPDIRIQVQAATDEYLDRIRDRCRSKWDVELANHSSYMERLKGYLERMPDRFNEIEVDHWTRVEKVEDKSLTWAEEEREHRLKAHIELLGLNRKLKIARLEEKKAAIESQLAMAELKTGRIQNAVSVGLQRVQEKLDKEERALNRSEDNAIEVLKWRVGVRAMWDAGFEVKVDLHNIGNIRIHPAHRKLVEMEEEFP